MEDVSGLRPETRYGIPTADLVLYNRQYIVGYSFLFRQPRWALQLIDPISQRQGEDVSRAYSSFREDPRVPEMFRASVHDYRGSGYDRGHLISSADRMQRDVVNSETFLMSNISPQAPDFNRGIWRHLEQAVRELTKQKKYLEVYAISGPIFAIGDQIKVIGKNRVMVPTAYFKSVLAEDRRGKLQLWSFVIPNKGTNETPAAFLTPTTKVEWLVGLSLWNRLHGDNVRKLKSQKNEMWSFNG